MIFPLYEKFMQRFFPGKPKQPLLTMRMVSNNTMNNENNFWKPYIGTEVVIESFDPDGMVNVKVHNQDIIIRGIDPQRFT
jgi:hypothetical protein